MSAPLSEKAFQKLTEELGAILQGADQASSAEKVTGYWKVGRRIAQERISEEAGYHNAILRNVAQVLSVSTRALQYAVTFYQAYPRAPDGALQWAHYKLLAPLPTRKERTFYEKRAIAEGWLVRDLEAAIRANLFGGGTPPEDALPRPTSPSYIYRAASPRIIDADTLDLDIDLGFQTWTRRRIRLADVDCPEVHTQKGRAAQSFLQKHLARAQTIVVKTHKVDIHGRYVGHLFTSPQKVEVDECFESGTYVNAAIVAAGFGVIVG